MPDDLQPVLLETTARVLQRKAKRDEAEAVPYTLANLLEVADFRALQEWREGATDESAMRVNVPQAKLPDFVDITPEEYEAGGYAELGYVRHEEDTTPDPYRQVRVAYATAPR